MPELSTLSPAVPPALAPAPTSPGRIPPVDLALVAAPMLLATALCLVGLDARSIGFDEGATLAIASQSGHALSRAIARDGGNMSGYYLLLHVLIRWLGDGPWVLRTPSAVFAGATAGLIAAIGRTVFDRRVAAVAGLLGAVSLPLVYWGETARGYAAMVCFATAGMLAFVHWVRALEQGRRTRGPALAYLVVMALAAYASFVAVVLVVAQLAVLIRRPAALRRFLLVLLVLGLLGVPLAILAVRRGSGQLFWLPRPDWPGVEGVLQMLSSSGLTPNFPKAVTTTPGWVLTVLAILGLGVLVRRDPATGSSTSSGRGVRLVLAWVIVPGALMFLYSLVAPQPLFLSRNLLVSMPAVALALAVLLADRRLPRWSAAVGLAVALAVRITPLAASYGVSPEAWESASLHVLDAARPGDCMAFYPEDGRNAFRWYLDRERLARPAPRDVLPTLPWRVSASEVEIYATLSPHRIAALSHECRRLWLVSSHPGQSHGPALSRRHRGAWLLLSYRLERAFGPASITTFGYASPIQVALLTRR